MGGDVSWGGLWKGDTGRDGRQMGEVRAELTAHQSDVPLVLGEVLNWEVGVEVFEGGERGVLVCKAGVGEAREGVVVAVWDAESAFVILISK